MKNNLLILLILLLGIVGGVFIFQRTHNAEQPLMSSDEIADFNREIIEQGNLNRIDLATATFTADEVRAMIEKYTIDAKAIYLDEDTITEADKTAILASRNLDALPADLVPQYGLCVCPTPMRSFPTLAVSTKDRVVSGPLCFDDFQQNQVLLGAGVIILHATADSSWYFVHSFDYAAWVQAKDIQIVTKDAMLDYLSAEPFVVTTRMQHICLHGDSVLLNIGTRLPLRWGKILLPDGKKVAKSTLICHEGYLPLTTANLMELAFSQEGNPYDWGSRWGYNDCTGFVGACCRACGLYLPRNSGDMRKINRALNFDKSTVDWVTLPVGTILLTKGHALFYIGLNEEGLPQVLHSHTSWYSRETHASDPRGLVEVTGVYDYYYSDTTDLSDVLVRYLPFPQTHH